MDPQTPAAPPPATPPPPTEPAPMMGPSLGVPTTVAAPKTSNKATAIVAFFIAFLALLIGLGGWQSGVIPHNYVHTTGTVIREQQSAQSNNKTGGYTYVPVIQFTVNGKAYTVTGTTAEAQPSAQVGQTQQVAYNPANPGQDPKDASDTSGAIWGPILMVIGVGCVIFGLFKLLRK